MLRGAPRSLQDSRLFENPWASPVPQPLRRIALKRGDWPSRDALVAHLDASWREYNQLFAHPFQWSWTRAKLDEWIFRHGQ